MINLWAIGSMILVVVLFFLINDSRKDWLFKPYSYLAICIASGWYILMFLGHATLLSDGALVISGFLGWLADGFVQHRHRMESDTR